MKEHKVSVDNKPHTIRISKMDSKTPFSVEIDGKICRVELLNDLEFGKPILVKTNGKAYKIELDEFKKNAPFFVRVNNKPYKVVYEIAQVSPTSNRVMEPTLLISRKQPLGKTLVEKENAVTAPMPGMVVSLKVKVGDSVNMGQPLCILEAMKMENEITAPKAGVVKEIHVSEGSSVSQRQPIIIIE